MSASTAWRWGARSPNAPLADSVADFSQADFDVSLAIDDDASTGWAIHPEVGKPHTPQCLNCARS
jgi:hypothetical protein